MSEAHEAAAAVPTEATDNKSVEEVSPPKEIEKSEEKAPETPVTEPMTNGSTTPESPKEELRQNGDLSPLEKSSEESTLEVIPKIEAIPAEQQPNDLPLNGLQINEVADENIQPPAEPAPLPIVIPESLVAEAIPEASISVNPVLAEPIPIESLSTALPASEELKMDLSPEIEVSPKADIPEVLAGSATVISEVCDIIQEAQTVEAAPPPLPSNPPPSSLTAFAQSTMAAHLSAVQDLPVEPVAISKITDAPSSDNIAQNILELVAPIAPDQSISDIELSKNEFNLANEIVKSQIDNIPDIPNFLQPINVNTETSNSSSPVEDNNISEAMIPKTEDVIAVVSPQEPSPIIPQIISLNIISEADKIDDPIEKSEPLINDDLSSLVNDKKKLISNVLSEVETLGESVSEIKDSQLPIISENHTNDEGFILENKAVSEIVSEIVASSVTGILEDASDKTDLISPTENNILQFVNLLESTETKANEIITEVDKNIKSVECVMSQDLLSDEIIITDNSELKKSSSSNFSSSENQEISSDMSKESLSPNLDNLVLSSNVVSDNKDESLSLPVQAVEDLSKSLKEDDLPLVEKLSENAVDDMVTGHSDLSKPPKQDNGTPIENLTKIALDEVITSLSVADIPLPINGVFSAEKNKPSHEEVLTNVTPTTNGIESKHSEMLDDIISTTDKLKNVPEILPVFSKEPLSQEDVDPIVSFHQSSLICGQPIPSLPTLQSEQPDVTIDASDKIVSSEPVVAAISVEPATADNGAVE